MRSCLLFLVTFIFSPIAVNNVQAGIVFSWVDAKGVMHFTDKKPTENEVESDKLTTKEVKVTNILESETATLKKNMPKELNSENQESLSEDINQVIDTNEAIVENESDVDFTAENAEPLIESVSESEEMIIDVQPIAILELSNKAP